MGLFDDLSKQACGLAALAMKNPQAIAAVVSLLSTRDSSVGGTGGPISEVDEMGRCPDSFCQTHSLDISSLRRRGHSF